MQKLLSSMKKMIGSLVSSENVMIFFKNIMLYKTILYGTINML